VAHRRPSEAQEAWVKAKERAEGKEKESNWLPAPNSTFYLVMRLYWPKQAALDGSWKAPAVKQVQ